MVAETLANLQLRLDRAKAEYLHVVHQVDLALKPLVSADPSCLDEVKAFQKTWHIHVGDVIEHAGNEQPFDPYAGPTIEEYVAAGYLPENYPPGDYKEKESPALEVFKATGKMPDPPADEPPTDQV